MTTIRPFRALRPPRDLASRVAAPPYDVVSADEARALVATNPESFLHISLPETNLDPGVTLDPEDVHRLGRATLEDFVHRGLLVQEGSPGLMVYRQRMGDSVQTGVVGCASVEEYRQGLIATHEHTRPDKENDRTRHIEVLEAHDEPIFLMYRPDAPGAAAIADAVGQVTSSAPDVEFTTDAGVTHTLWTVEDGRGIQALVEGFEQVPMLYIADGHHRSAAAARVGDDVAHEEAAFFPVVAFPADRLTVMAYNRVVRDLGEYSLASLLEALAPDFDIQRFDAQPTADAPTLRHHQFGLYSGGSWHLLTARDGLVDESDPIARLDVSILQTQVLAPLLGIEDPRTDQRIAFVGGIRGTAELVRLVDSGDFAAAFVLHPTSTGEVMDVADLGEDMPPKSTWFEPKLRSGLFVHPIDL
ncbi:MAG: DUF1015 domain-containing protein [Demequinaceae bacterium]|nr:DUF1015 domain-containing protein [Demequinaceae bacterium]